MAIMAREYLAFAGVAVSILVLYGVTSVIRQYVRLRHIKGPPGSGLSKWWLIRAVCSGKAHLDFYEACEKYGQGTSIVRVGPNDVMTSDPELVKRMLNVRSSYKRSYWYDAMKLDPGRDNVLSAKNDDVHGRLRSQMAAGYSGKEVDDFEAKIDQNILRLVALIEQYVDQGLPFDFGVKAQFFTLDVISDLAFGEPFGDLTTDSDVHEYVHTMEQNMPNIYLTTVLPWLLSLLSSPLLRGLLPSENDAIGVGKTIGIAKRVAAERFGQDKKVQRDMLGSFVAHGLNQEEASSEILMQILAGSDTTATAIRATLLHIMTSPRVLSSLRDEIRSFKPSWPVITEAESRAMPYLQAIIKEGLRMFPPASGQMSKVVPKGGDEFNGVYLPEGTRIGPCMWGIFRRADVWGADAHEFRPERWLEAAAADGEKLRRMESALELVFSYGRWQCLGRNVAMLELRKIFVELLRRFDLVLVDPTRPWHSMNYGIFVQSQFWIKGYRRDISA